ncbi:uncharacterized protein PAC_17407 [Phialocephala subalpina]|uniref:Ubiquitin-like domain-containing protein n=1 Tax=Phialocephala subalpina TaxID=576137 RepID=A0A1L7XRD1_9HELO|nr:uncharacterized protein PAC_17407 [Phialocephala subalpina]
MSFGWSAGDIAAALTVAYNLIQALDSVDGSASDYREAVSFLQQLKRTLEPLQTFTAWSAYPRYGADITEQVGFVKKPIEDFLAQVLKFEPSLGEKATRGHRRHVIRKLQWYLFMSKKVLSLRKKIESHMRVIDTLMQRLTMDMVWTTQQTLPDTLRTTFQETLRPELVAILREILPPLRSAEAVEDRNIQGNGTEILMTKISDNYEGIMLAMKDMQLQISNSTIMQQTVESSLRGRNSRARQRALLEVDSYCSLNENSGSTHLGLSALVNVDLLLPRVCVSRVLLDEPFSGLIEHGSAIASVDADITGSVQYLISGCNWEATTSIALRVLRAFIEDDFKSLPGSTWVDRGKYLVVSMANNRALNERNWSRAVVPGAKVAMSMIVRKRPGSFLRLGEERCPVSSCSGTWMRSETQSWTKCPVCEKEILNAVLESPQEVVIRDIKSRPNLKNRPNTGPLQGVPTPIAPRVENVEPEIDEDISVFKRIVQERDAKRIEREGTTTLPSCPRTTFVGGMDDWLTLPQCLYLDICPSCFASTIAPTEYGHFFVPAPRRSPKIEVLCDLGSNPWIRIAWKLTVKKRLPDLSLFCSLARITAMVQPCMGKYEDIRAWYSVVDPKTGAFIPNFNVCYSCVKIVGVLLQPTRGVFVQFNLIPMFRSRVCDLRIDSKRFFQYFDEALETMAERVDGGETFLPDTKDFAHLVTRLGRSKPFLKNQASSVGKAPR